MRVCDVIVSSVAVCAFSPLFVLVAIAIKLDSPGPVLFRGLRVGRNGAPFHLFKFRSMVVDAAERGPGITATGDPRVTRVGAFLRHTKLDELPQLLNVLRGEMSLVGPRPEDPRYVALYTLEQREVLAVRPGITGAASLAYRHEERLLSGPDWEKTYREQVLPDKISIELNYLQRRTWLTDLRLLLQTIRAVTN